MKCVKCGKGKDVIELLENFYECEFCNIRFKAKIIERNVGEVDWVINNDISF